VTEYRHKNLQEVDDMAPQFGFPPEMQAHFAREPMGLDRTGLTLFGLATGFRIPFGHPSLAQRGGVQFESDDAPNTGEVGVVS
jgi:hypothetical protein